MDLSEIILEDEREYLKKELRAAVVHAAKVRNKDIIQIPIEGKVISAKSEPIKEQKELE